MLGKQGQKLLTQLNSLLSRIYRGRYHPFATSTEAQVGTNPSWAWRSLLMGREILRRGTQWCIGNDNSVFSETDPWLPGDHPFIVTIRSDSSPPPPLVSSFITQAPQTGDVQLLHNYFDNTVKRIFEIPLPSIPWADRIVWAYTRNGMYSVKSLKHNSLLALTGVVSSNLN